MINLLHPDHPIHKLKAGTIVRGLIKEIQPPSATSEAKQRVTLEWPGEESVTLGCNFIGTEMHLSEDKVGKVIDMRATTDTALYLSKFDDGKFLTVRNGAVYTFRDPKPGTVPTVDDRIAVLADHYVKCKQAVAKALSECGLPMSEDEIQKVSTSIWIDTKGAAKVKPSNAGPRMAQEQPQEKTGDPMPTADPTSQKPSSPPPAEVVKCTEDQVANIITLPEDVFAEKAAHAILYIGAEKVRLQFQDAFPKAANSIQSSYSHEKPPVTGIWTRIMNTIYEMVPSEIRDKMDGAIEHAEEKHHGQPQWKKDRAVAMLTPVIIREN